MRVEKERTNYRIIWPIMDQPGLDSSKMAFREVSKRFLDIENRGTITFPIRFVIGQIIRHITVLKSLAQYQLKNSCHASDFETSVPTSTPIRLYRWWSLPQPTSRGSPHRPPSTATTTPYTGDSPSSLRYRGKIYSTQDITSSTR